MSGISGAFESRRTADILAVLARWILAAVFLHLGITKALHPEEFLRLVRQYGVFEQSIPLNLVAATLPWIEILCGLLLVSGVAVRGTALLVATMLAGFTIAILIRALELRATGGLALCAITFDCGCGGGEVLVCRKLGENLLLATLALWLVFCSRGLLCLKHTVVGESS